MLKKPQIFHSSRSKQRGFGRVREDCNRGDREHSYSGESVPGGEDAGHVPRAAGTALQNRPPQISPDRYCLRRLHGSHVLCLCHRLLFRGLHDQGKRDDLYWSVSVSHLNERERGFIGWGIDVFQSVSWKKKGFLDHLWKFFWGMGEGWGKWFANMGLFDWRTVCRLTSIWLVCLTVNSFRVHFTLSVALSG